MADSICIQDPANPKPKKCKERAKDKVPQTEKVVAKARAERESAKKVKMDLSVEVNSSLVGSRPGEADISLQSSDFIPQGSPGYASRSPSPAWEETEKTTTKAVVPFTKMSKEYGNKRVNEAMVIVCTETDPEHITKSAARTR